MIVIILFILISIVAFFLPKGTIVKQIVFLFLGFVLILAAGFRGENYRDYSNYVDYFNQEDTLLVEPAFILISNIIHLFSANVIYLFVVFAILGVALKLVAIRQLTTLWFLSLVIYVSYFFIMHEMIQIRAAVASGILLLCINPIYDRDWKRFLLLALLATSFHYSALVILPFWFLGHKPRKMWLLLSIPLAYLVYFSHINLIAVLPIPGIKEKLEMYKELQELGDPQWSSINVFNILFLTKILVFYFVLWKYDLIVARNKYAPILMKVYCISLVFFLVFATMPVIAFRLNELCGIVDIILIPLLFYAFQPSWFAKLIVIFIGFGFMSIVLFYEKLIS